MKLAATIAATLLTVGLSAAAADATPRQARCKVVSVSVSYIDPNGMPNPNGAGLAVRRTETVAKCRGRLVTTVQYAPANF